MSVFIIILVPTVSVVNLIQNLCDTDDRPLSVMAWGEGLLWEPFRRKGLLAGGSSLRRKNSVSLFLVDGNYILAHIKGHN